jgi:hypothetical protein
MRQLLRSEACTSDDMQDSPQVEAIFFDAGGGHRAAAMALKSIVERQRRPWQIRMVNLRDVLDPVDTVRKLAGIRTEDAYNFLLKYGLTIGTGPMLRATQVLIRGIHSRAVAVLQSYWQSSAPRLVLSLVPNFNRTILKGLRAADAVEGRALTPMVTVLTDLADYPPHFWMERQDQYLICGTAMAMEQALAMGHPPERLFRTSGMIVRPEFYQPIRVCRSQERRRLGLNADLPTGLVTFGGFGSRRMITIARNVAQAGLDIQLIFLCGHNQPLRERLAAMALPFPCHVEGFTHDVPYFMHLADFFIGKPGPGSISEALVMGLPVIVERNAWTMVQERYNTEWISHNRLGIVLRSFTDIAAGIRLLLDPQYFDYCRSRVDSLDNRAVFEIPEILEGLIHERSNERDAGNVFAHQDTGPRGYATDFAGDPARARDLRAV